jgi:NADH-quinone oxidoreductase subunit N
VYEGAPSLITAYMSTVVKAAGFAAFLRLFSACFAIDRLIFGRPYYLIITVVSPCLLGTSRRCISKALSGCWHSRAYRMRGIYYLLLLLLGANSANAVLVYATAYSIASIIAFGGINTGKAANR